MKIFWVSFIIIISLIKETLSATLTHTTYDDFFMGERYAVEIIGTPNATLQLTRPMLFYDKFDEPDGPAKNWTPQAAPPNAITGTWTVKNKTYEGNAQVAGGWCYSVAGDAAWQDYIYEAKCRLEDAAPNADYVTVGMAFRYRDINNFFRFRYLYAPVDNIIRVDLYARVNGKWSLLAESPYNLEMKRWYYFKVEVSRITDVNVNIKCYVNGQLLINYTGDYQASLPTGKIALYNYQSLTYYDDVWVADLKPNYNPAGTFTSACINLKGEADFGTISWQPLNQPANTTIKIQLATNNDAQTYNFIGPDGSPDTYYTQAEGSPIYLGHDGNKFLKYKILFETKDLSLTPTLDSITITYTTITQNPAPPDLNLISAEDTRVGDSVKVTWEKSPDMSVVGYKVYYSQNYFVNVKDATLYQTINNPDITDCEVIGLITNNLYYFAVTAFDQEGNEDKEPTDIYTAMPTYGSILVIFSDKGSGVAEDPAEIKKILNNLGYSGKYGCWSVAKRNWPELARLKKFNVVLFFSGAIFEDSIIRAFAASLFSYVSGGGNVALLGEDMGYDATSDGWINTADFQNLFRVANYEDSVGEGNARLTINHPITKYIGGTGTTFYCSGPYLDGYTTLVETTYTKQILSWTQNATYHICGVAYDGHQESPKKGRIFYFSGIFYDALGRGIQSPQVRSDLIKGLLEWLCEPISSTPAYVEVTPKAATLTYGTSYNFSCQAYDELNNPIPNKDYSWEVINNIGTISPVTGTLTKFTAQNLGTGLIKATCEGIFGTASLSIIPAVLSISLSKNSINFGTFSPGQWTATETVSATNTGSVNINISVILGTFTNGSIFWNLANIPATDTCSFYVGTQTDTLSIIITEYNKEYTLFQNIPPDNSFNIYIKLGLPLVVSQLGKYNSFLVINASTP